jgi:hypothetical protein
MKKKAESRLERSRKSKRRVGQNSDVYNKRAEDEAIIKVAKNALDSTEEQGERVDGAVKIARTYWRG